MKKAAPKDGLTWYVERDGATLQMLTCQEPRMFVSKEEDLSIQKTATRAITESVTKLICEEFGETIQFGIYAQEVGRALADAKDKETAKLAWRRVQQAVHLAPRGEAFISIQTAAELYLVDNFIVVRKARDPFEIRSVHPLFKKCIPKLWSDALALRVGTNKNQRCDFLLRIGGVVTPVEIKKHCFDARAMGQLASYMTAYQTRRGVAVGEDLGAAIPSGVEFVPISRLLSLAA